MQVRRQTEYLTFNLIAILIAQIDSDFISPIHEMVFSLLQVLLLRSYILGDELMSCR